MEKKSGIITQSNYIPWKGYFDAIISTDVFVVYDEMQYTKRDWRNRNLINTPNGPSWLSIPVEVKGKFHQKINETKIADPKWNKSHWGILEQNYKKAPFFKEVSSWLKPLYLNNNSVWLTEINMAFIRSILNFLNCTTEVHFSKDFKLAEDKTQRLVDLCTKLKVTDYYSGPAAKNYMDDSIFKKQDIQLHYWDYSGYQEYPQIHPNFEHGVSILDMLFNLGDETKSYLKSQ